MSYYADSRNRYSQKPTTITQSRGSSADSRTSSSQSSTDGKDTSSKTTMANSIVVEEKHRVPDNVRHYVKSRTNGNVKVINQEKGIYDEGAPLASEATYEDYKRTQRREEKQRRSEGRR